MVPAMPPLSLICLSPSCRYKTQTPARSTEARAKVDPPLYTCWNFTPSVLASVLTPSCNAGEMVRLLSGVAVLASLVLTPISMFCSTLPPSASHGITGPGSPCLATASIAPDQGKQHAGCTKGSYLFAGPSPSSHERGADWNGSPWHPVISSSHITIKGAAGCRNLALIGF